jgi:Na+/proline symporter
MALEHFADAIGVSLILLIIFGSFASIFIVPRYFKSRERQKLQDTIRLAIEKGQELPPDLLEAMTRDIRPASSRTRDIRTGIIWMFIAAGIAGFGLAIGYYSDEAIPPFLGIAAIPGAIGLAYVVLSFFNPKR